MIIDFNFPLEPFNSLVKNGTVGQKLQQILEDVKPEAVYFSERNGQRGGLMILDVADPSKVPAIAEPLFLTFDANNPNSILSSLRAARENARSIRETLSSPVWAEINEAYLYVEHHANKRTDTRHNFRKHVVRASHSVEGATNATLSHAEAWHFSRIGRLLERADKTTRIVDMRYFMLLPSPADIGSPTEDLHWTAVLQSVSALEMYRQRHGMVQLDRTAEFLILDPDFPRSVRNCLRRADESLHAITGTASGTFKNQAERRLGRLAAELDYTAIDEVIIHGLHEFLDTLQVKLNGVGAALQDTFFAPRVHAPS